jgi:ribosomal protein S18 acetylase RimI-like enzyme
MEWSHAGYRLTDDPGRVDFDAVTELLRATYWASSRTRAQIEATVRHSRPFSLLAGGEQVGFARVLSDVGAISYLCDLVIDPRHRGRGLGRFVVAAILAHPDLAETRVFLITRDAQALYRRLGFATHPYECMVRPAAPAPA